MAVRTIIRVDRDNCTGCGLCVPDCEEGALQIVDGKACLVKEIYCDGLGDCLGACPEGALTLEDREAEAFDEVAVNEHLEHLRRAKTEDPLPCGCPGSAVRTLEATMTVGGRSRPVDHAERGPAESPELAKASASALAQWPVQLSLVPPGAPFLQGAYILVCADCVPFAMADVHARFMAGRAVLVGCPKLDDVTHYRSKLERILREAQPKSITVLRMEVPCCGGLTHLVQEAYRASGVNCPLDVRVVEIACGGIRA